MNIEQQYEQVKNDLKKVGDELRVYAEQSQKEVKRTQEMSAETKASVDALLIKQGELNARLAATEQLMAKLEAGGMGGPAKAKTLGEQVAESAEYKNFSGRGSIKITNLVTSDSGSAGTLIQPHRLGLIAPQQQLLTIRDLMMFGRTASNSIEYVIETGFDNNADVVSENPTSGKPESDLEFELDSAPVATIAHWIHASKQVLSDAPMLASYIDGRMQYGLKRKEEQQLLMGSGVGMNLNGIYTQAIAYANPGVSVAAETAIDRLRIAMLQVALAEFSADGIVLSPIDWATIELTKDANYAYLFATPQGRVSAGLWGVPVVATESMSANDFLVGSFSMGAQGWDREDVSVVLSTEDRDNFIKNMVTILCEERIGLTVTRPESFVKGDFDGLSFS